MQSLSGFVPLIDPQRRRNVQLMTPANLNTEPSQPPTDAMAREPAGAARGEGALLELSREECLELLASHSFGRLAVVMSNGDPVIRPVNYIFDQRSRSVVFRTAGGSKLHALLRAAKAAFEVDEIDADKRTGWSVIIEGVTAEVTSPAEVRRLDELGLDHWAPGPKPHWIQIRAWTVSGRRILAAGETKTA